MRWAVGGDMLPVLWGCRKLNQEGSKQGHLWVPKPLEPQQLILNDRNGPETLPLRLNTAQSARQGGQCPSRRCRACEE